MNEGDEVESTQEEGGELESAPKDDAIMGDEEYEQFEEELRELHELENMKIFLEVEKDRLTRQTEALTSELEGINVAMSSAEVYLASYEKRKKDHSHNIEKAAEKQAVLADEVSSLHYQVKATREDIATTSTLEKSFQGELSEIDSEKTIVLNRLNDITAGLQRIDREKDFKVPHLQWYDGTLKKIYNVFIEAQNRMEVSMIMKKK